MAYKQLYISGHALVDTRWSDGYKLKAEDIKVNRITSEDDFGEVIFIYDLKAELRHGYFHIEITADKNKIISIEEGAEADEDGTSYDLKKLSITYGRDPYINYLHGQS